jgi:hypothetical protein
MAYGARSRTEMSETFSPVSGFTSGGKSGPPMSVEVGEGVALVDVGLGVRVAGRGVLVARSVAVAVERAVAEGTIRASDVRVAGVSVDVSGGDVAVGGALVLAIVGVGSVDAVGSASQLLRLNSAASSAANTIADRLRETIISASLDPIDATSLRSQNR